MSSENKKLKILSYVACFMVLGAFAMVLFYAPIEQNMGIVQKVFFFHVSAAWIGMLAFLVAAICGILYLTKKRMIFDPIAFSAVEIGLLFTAIANFSGMIWAKPIWNTWWTWDPRLTTMTIMAFTYIGYLLLRAAWTTGKTGTFWGGLCDHWLCQCSADLFLLPVAANHSPDHLWGRHWRYGNDFRHVSGHGCGDCCLHGSFCRTPLAPLYSGCARDGDRCTQGANGDSGVWRGAG